MLRYSASRRAVYTACQCALRVPHSASPSLSVSHGNGTAAVAESSCKTSVYSHPEVYYGKQHALHYTRGVLTWMTGSSCVSESKS